MADRVVAMQQSRVLQHTEKDVWPVSEPMPAAGLPRIVAGYFDASGNAAVRTAAAHSLGLVIPAKSIVLRAWYDVLTTFTTAASDAGTIAFSLIGANDILTAIAVSDVSAPFAVGLHAITLAALLKPATDTGLTVTVALHALTAGKLILFAEYINSN